MSYGHDAKVRISGVWRDAEVGGRVDGVWRFPPPPATDSLEMRGDPSFSISRLDNSKADQYGVTHHGWYQRMLNSIALRTYDADFDRNSNRPWNRTGNQAVTLMLIAFRYTGHMLLLDEAVRLMELAWNRMSTVGGRRYWEGFDQDLDTPLAAGLVACVMWACHHNRDLTSPAGHPYGAIADKYHTWLVNDFLPHWDQNGGVLPSIRKFQQHTWVNQLRILWYVGRKGGGWGKTPQQFFDGFAAGLTTRLNNDATGAIGHGGRTVRIYSHTANASGSDTSRAIQYTTYIGNEITAYIDLLLERADARLNDTFMTEWANAYADFVCDGVTGQPFGRDFGRTIAGDREPLSVDCTLPYTATVTVLGKLYHHCYRQRNQHHQTVRNGDPALCGWDSRNHMEPYMFNYYPQGGSAGTPTYVGFAASRVFTLFYHGR